MAQFDHFLSAFGPAAILLGAAFEGQTVVIAGGVLARQHTISVWVATLAAALGTGLIDYALFILGRAFRHTAFVQRVAAKPAFAKAMGMIERYPTAFILSFRFLYGLRAAGPVAIGVSRVSQTRFALLNALAAGIWAGLFVALGYLFGPAVLRALDAALAHAAPLALGTVLVAAALFALWRWRVSVQRADSPVSPGA